MSKEFKYQSYLDKYKNCPKDCEEKDLIAYRWVNSHPSNCDFYPVNLHPKIAARIVDDSDMMCTSYGLSLFKDLKSSIQKYIKDYNNRDRKSKKDKFKNEKGTCTAKVRITKADGVCDTPVSSGHFNFFEYKDCNLLTTITEKIDIFAYSGIVK